METTILKIGEVAARSGISIDTLRYYERLGLLPKPARTHSGYRLYEAWIVSRLAFIKRAQSFGFTLDEIKQMLQLGTADPQTCSRVLEMIEHKLEDLNHQYEEIKRLRHELSAYKTECERAIAKGQGCPVIEDFVQSPCRVGAGGGKGGRR
ncbi:MAG: heavy metal-responsive transcriptional regulator [Acidobacteria bacterium]|nr:heavy metal-responsive transcriptional regulator [Acidobacteriota bacterium]